jgi:hypothetical protein
MGGNHLKRLRVEGRTLEKLYWNWWWSDTTIQISQKIKNTPDFNTHILFKNKEYSW